VSTLKKRPAHENGSTSQNSNQKEGEHASEESRNCRDDAVHKRLRFTSDKEKVGRVVDEKCRASGGLKEAASNTQERPPLISVEFIRWVLC
jgi:hypothetical protein